MGYYTRYELEDDCTDIATLEKIDAAKAKSNIPDGGYSLEDDGRGGTKRVPSGGTVSINDYVGEDEEPSKWYNHEEEMAAFSKRFPGVVFTLNGEGEEQGDRWTKYFKDGLVQVEKMQEWTAPKFDAKKLKKPEALK